MPSLSLKKATKDGKKTRKESESRATSSSSSSSKHTNIYTYSNKNKNNSQHTQSTSASTDMDDTLRTYDDDASLAKQAIRQEIDECQARISRLCSMVQKMEVGMEQEDGCDQSPKKSSSSRSTTKSKNKSQKTQKTKPERSSYNSSNNDGERSTSTSHSAGIQQQQQQHQQQQQQQQPLHNRSGHGHSRRRHSIVSSSRGSLRSADSQGASFHSGRNIGRSRLNSRNSIRRDSIRSCRSSFKGGITDDNASVVSHKSLQSIGPSIRSLPREIELMDDDNDNYSFCDDSFRRQSQQYDESDSRSIDSRSGHSQASRQRSRRSLRRTSLKPSSESGGSFVSDSQSLESRSGHSQTSSRQQRSRGRKRNNVSRQTSFNASNDTIPVENQQVLDPYGEKGVYSGALSKSTGMPNGRGLLEYMTTGRWCEGDWIHGRLTGYGRLSNGAGDYYEGSLKNDHFHGTGIMRFDNGRIFEGEYVRGQMVLGKMTYQDGSVYDGEWVACARHGRGRCVFVDGSVYEGEFKEGHFHGHGQMTWNDGGYYIGEWAFGEMHGSGQEIRPNGALRHDGEWAHDQPIRKNTSKKN